MTKIKPRADAGNSSFPLEEDHPDSGFVPLSAEQAQQWRLRNPPVSLWRVLATQVAAGVAATLALSWVAGWQSAGRSAAWGALAVAVPAALFARALSRQGGRAGSALVMLFVWEGVKVILTVVLLLLAPGVLGSVNWLALVAGFVITLKAYWLALWRLAARQSR